MATVKEIDAAHKCKLVNNTVRCECGGQVSVGATVHILSDLGVGFVGGKLRTEARYGRKVRGYEGFCLKCRKEGIFMLAK